MPATESDPKSTRSAAISRLREVIRISCHRLVTGFQPEGRKCGQELAGLKLAGGLIVVKRAGYKVTVV